MRVLHVYKTYFPDSLGGVEQVIKEVILSTSAHGVESSVLSLSLQRVDPTITVYGHPVHRCKSTIDVASTPMAISVFKRFSKLAKKADIIHYHFPWPFADLLHFACRINKPSVVTYHSDIVKQKRLLKLYQPLCKKFLTSVDSIVATSPNYFSTSETLQSFPDKTRVIPIGLDKSYYSSSSELLKSQWKRRFPDKFFLFVGVFRYYKGLHILIEAAEDVDTPIVIVGSGPIEHELKTHAAKLGLTNIHFLGSISHEDKVALLELSYAIVFPSHLRAEAFGISLLEGAMFGKPMISSEIGTGTTYINIDQETGLVITPNDPKGLAKAMNALVDNPVWASELGAKAEKRYQALFTAEKMGREYFDVYRELLF